MIISCAFDDNYAYPGILSILSAKSALGENLSCVYMGYDENLLGGASLKLISEIMALSGVDVIQVPISIPKEWQGSGHISTMTFAKPMIADFLSEPHLWIDSDAFVLRDFTSELEASSSGKVRMVPHWAMSNDGVESVARENDLAFYNAGVILWPEARLGRPVWLDYVAQKGQSNLLFGDQEVMNQVYNQDTIPMGGVFNANYAVANLNCLIEDPFVVHFPGSQKPWLVPKNARKRCTEVGCGFLKFWELEKTLLSQFPEDTRHALESTRLKACRNGSLSSRILYAFPQIAKLTKSRYFFHPYCHK